MIRITHKERSLTSSACNANATHADREGELLPDHDVLITELGTYLAARDYAGFVNRIARHLDADTARLAVALMDQSGGVLVLIAVILRATDPFLEKMQRAWSRPSPQEPRKRYALETMRRQLTPAMAGFILDSILAINISEDRTRFARDADADGLPVLTETNLRGDVGS